MHRMRIGWLLGLFWLGNAMADDRSPIDALRAKHAHGIPWHVELQDLDGKPLGSIDMRITSERGHSCLGSMSNGVRVEFVRKDVSSTLFIGSYGVATFIGQEVSVDLTGGICDAYLLMDGRVAADGSSSGVLSTLGLRGGREKGSYRATVK